MLDTLLRTVSLFLLTLVCFRVMGYRSLGDMEPFDFVIVLAIAEIMGAPLAEHKINPWFTALAIILLTILQIVLSYIALKNKLFRKLIEGEPVPVIRDGKVLYKNLKAARFSTDDLNEELRVQGISSPGDVKLANLEPSGRFSVILKKESEPLTARFLKIPVSYTVISRGEIDFPELEKTSLTVENLEMHLRQIGISDLKIVENATIDTKGNLTVEISSGIKH